MVHSALHKFVVAILSKGQVLREIGNRVFMPDNSEYSIRIKNPTFNAVAVSISIDGTSVTSDKIIIEANSTFDLSRMMIDGNLSTGPKLLFVNRYNEKVSDPTSEELGLVKIQFFKEDISEDISSVFGNGLLRSGGWSSSEIHVKGTRVTYSTGATIPGENTIQEFRHSHRKFDEFICELCLQLCLREDQPLFVNSTNFCTNCGAKLKPLFKFCPGCGTKVQN